MNYKRIGSIVIFLVLLAISVVLGFAYWNTYLRKKDVVTPEPTPTPDTGDNTDNTGNDTPPVNDTADPNIGMDAYAGLPATLYNIDLTATVKNLNAGEYIGKITGNKEVSGVPYFIIDGQYLVSKGLVVAR